MYCVLRLTNEKFPGLHISAKQIRAERHKTQHIRHFAPVLLGYHFPVAIIYSDDMDDLTPESLNGFFAAWETPPSTATHLRMLQQSTFSIVAKDGPKVVGYLTALSDGVLFACISGIEVLSDYRGRNIGQELVRMALAHFKDIYAVDLVCEPALQPFYLKLGFEAFPGTCIRNNLKKSGVESKKRVATLS